ncbi:TPA: PefC/AfrB family outer membrane usher protein [Escherichia coli]|nr:PefC/AfrB family outer membrane usher protein [Escherichia coli]
MQKYRVAASLSLLPISIISSYVSAEELNFDFLQGTETIPSVLKTDTAFPQGEYFVDVVVNKEKTGRLPLVINQEEENENMLCLSPEWLSNAGVLFNPQSYQDVFSQTAGCYRLEKKSPTRINFDYGNQTLNLDIPQAYLLSKTDPVRWDYGIPGGRLKYYANFNKSSEGELNVFGNAELGINLGRWVLSGNMNGSKYADKTEFTASDLTLSTAVSQIQGDFLLGKSTTRTESFNDFGFYGMSLRSNVNMRPWDVRGYAPEINGVASTSSRITVKQAGYTIYSTVVPAGPYHLNDLRPVGNGDLVVTVEDERGHITETTYPVSTLPTLLRPGEFEYNVAVGRKNTSDKLNEVFSSGEGTFWLGSLGYGFDTTTINSALLIHNKYQGAGLGLTQSLGGFGAFYISGNTSIAKYNSGKELKGNSFSMKYAKSIGNQTDLQLIGYRYRGKEYTEFAQFSASDRETDMHLYSPKSRYEARVSHNINGGYLSASFWQEDYWNMSGKRAGASLGASTMIPGNISLSLNGSWSQSPDYNRDDYSVSLGISVPFSLGEQQYYSNSSVGYSRYDGTSFNAGASATVSERFYYSANTGVNSHGGRNVDASASYAFDAVQTNMNISQSHNGSGNITSVSGGISGSLLATTQTGFLFSKEASGTVGIMHVPDVEGIKFNGSMPTDKNGNAVVWLSEYSDNHININMESVPDNLELKNTSLSVVPTEKAIIYREFNAEYVKRYILQVRDRNNKPLTGGNVVTEQGVNAGYIANNGVLLVNLLAKPESLKVSLDNGYTCHIPAKDLKPNNGKVQEVVCE